MSDTAHDKACEMIRDLSGQVYAAELEIEKLRETIRDFKRFRHDEQCIDHLAAGLECSCYPKPLEATDD